MQIFERLSAKPWILMVLYAAMALFISIRSYQQPLKTMPGYEGGVTTYNNYILFSNSFWHLLEGKNLYAAYPAEQYDVFKYSPTFALFFAPFSALPHSIGLALWNLLNAVVFIIALRQLRLPPVREWGFGLLAIQEAFTTTANSQSNMLIAGLLILAYVQLERGKIWLPVFFIALTVFIKVFGLLFFAMILLYPQRWKCLIPALVCAALLFLLPLPFGGLGRLLQHYREYAVLLAGDHGTFIKYSVMGWLQSWFNLSPDKNAAVLIGLAIQCMPLLFWKRFSNPAFRQVYAASWLIWLVIFNHMAESATFILAVAGVLLWYYAFAERKTWHILLLLPVLFFTCMGPSDIYPKAWRVLIVETWQLKVFPCIAVWLACIMQLYLPKGVLQAQK